MRVALFSFSFLTLLLEATTAFELEASQAIQTLREQAPTPACSSLITLVQACEIARDPACYCSDSFTASFQLCKASVSDSESALPDPSLGCGDVSIAALAAAPDVSSGSLSTFGLSRTAIAMALALVWCIS